MIVVTLFIMIVFGSEQLCLVQPKHLCIMKKIALLILLVCSLAQSQITFKHVATYTDEEFRGIRRGGFPVECVINNPLINNNPNLVLIVTPDWGTIGPYFTGAYSVHFFDNRWRINCPNGEIPENTKFNVLAMPRSDRAFVHVSRITATNYSIIDHPLLNNNPEAKFLITKASFRNSKDIGIGYSPLINKWTILNLDRSLFDANSYNVVIIDGIFNATGVTTSGNWFAINNPTTNDGRNNLVFTTQIFQGAATSINPTGVWYSGNKWNIFNQNRVAMPVNAKFMVSSFNSSGYVNRDNEVHVFLNDINEILCPQTVTRGDREFNGNGPRIQTNVTLQIRNNIEIWAIINFTATETVSDFSTTNAVFERRIFTSPNNRTIAQIITPATTNVDFITPSAGMQIIGPVGESSNTVTVTEPMNFIRSMSVVGDTGGDDISTDNDCTDDTRIERISFFPIKIRFAN
jgi:hypothetical protein